MSDVTAQAFREAADATLKGMSAILTDAMNDQIHGEERDGAWQVWLQHEHTLQMLLLAAAEQREQWDRERGEREALQRHFDIHVQQASENIDDFLSKIEELTAKNEALKAGIRGDLGGGNSLPDFWTAERQLPYVATALNKSQAEIATLTAERDAMRRRAEAAESDWQEVTAERDKTVAVLTHERDEARTLARQAVNGWACYAKRNAEHDEIAEIHAALDAPSRPA